MRRLACALLALAATSCSRPQPQGSPPPGISTAATAPTGAASTFPGQAPPSTDGGIVDAAPVRPALPATVKINIKSKPKATVFWGKKNLGDTPLVIERPRDSAPLDLVLRAPGYFPVHTRAYTFRNDRLQLDLVKLEDRMTLFGARKELPPAEPPPQDGGADPLPSGTPPGPPAPEISPDQPAEPPVTPLVQPLGPLQ